jgi:excisionase family DNA binding protein
MDTSKKLLTVPEAAAVLGLSRSLLYEMVTRGEVPSLKIGRARRIPVMALDTFIAERLADHSCIGPTPHASPFVRR